MGTSREGKVTQRTPFSAAQRETRASRCCYQVYFISLCWHKKEVIELFFRFLRHDISRRRNRPLVAASEFRFLSPNLRNVQEEKYTILSRISYTTHFRNDLLLLLCMSTVCHVFPYLLLQPIDYTSTRGGVSVLTNKAETTVSSLIIQKAAVEDGGVYSCQAGQIEPTSVKIHVLTGTYGLKFLQLLFGRHISRC